jgi:hypothetical protein
VLCLCGRAIMKAAGFDEVIVLARITSPAGCSHILYSDLKEQSPESMRTSCDSSAVAYGPLFEGSFRGTLHHRQPSLAFLGGLCVAFRSGRTPSRRTPISVPKKEREGVPAPSPRRLVGGNFRKRTPRHHPEPQIQAIHDDKV